MLYDLRHPLSKFLYPILDGMSQRHAIQFQTGSPGWVERYIYPYKNELLHAYGWKPGDLQQECVIGNVKLGIKMTDDSYDDDPYFHCAGCGYAFYESEKKRCEECDEVFCVVCYDDHKICGHPDSLI